MSKFLILVVGLGDGTASSGFRFRAMTDKDMDGTNVPVFDVMYDNATLFKVDPTNGKIYFGTNFWYDPADGAIHTPNDKTVIKADGTIEAVDGSFTGNIIANSGLFKGIFDTTALKLEPSTATAYSRNEGADGYQAMDYYNYFAGILGTVHDKIYRASIPSGTYYIRTLDGRVDFTINGDDLFYVRFVIGDNGYDVHLYDSSYTRIGFLATYSIKGVLYSLYFSVATTLTIYAGGDKLLVSSDMPQTSNPSSLDNYQLYIDPSTGNMKVKLP